jgi:hypothetical protein
MGTREKKQRRKTVVNKIHYQEDTDEFYLVTPCPFGRKIRSGSIDICVGSGFCQECEDFQGMDEKLKIVSCLRHKNVVEKPKS